MRHTIIEPRILDAYLYNSIPRFEDQIHTIAPSSLRAIGEIFVEHRVEDDYGVGLLHRHFDLPDGHVMIHHTTNDADMCRPSDMQDVCHPKLGHHSLLLDSDLKFRAYEYEIDANRQSLPEQFLRELRTLLTSLKLERTLAIVSQQQSIRDTMTIETIVPEVDGMYSVPKTKGAQDIQDDQLTVVTGWRFRKDPRAQIQVQEAKRCVKNVAGVHEVKDLVDVCPGNELADATTLR